MRPTLSRILSIFAIITAIAAGASDVFAQTLQLNKTLERKFPEDYCPLDTNFLGTFVTDTGIIRLTFKTRDDDGTNLKGGIVTVAFNQKLDDISIIEAAEFAANSVENSAGCYFDGPPFAPVYTGSLVNNPKVPFYEPFSPVASPCPWDLSDGAAIQNGELIFTGGSVDGFSTTSVVISGLTPGTAYVLHGNWSANNFLLPDQCGPEQACLEVTVEDLEEGCTTLPVRETTWGAVKALYQN